MEDLYISEITEIINCILLNSDATAKKISGKTAIAVETVRHILIYLYDNPFGGIELHYSGYMQNTDITKLDTEVFDSFLKWSADISRMDKVPVENLSEDELFILTSLMQEEKELLESIERAANIQVKDSLIYTKGIGENTNELYQCQYYSVLRNAMLNKRIIDGVLVTERGEQTVRLKPIGIVYSTEEDLWFIIAEDEKSMILPYNIQRLRNLAAGESFQFPKDFSLKEYVRGFFSMNDVREEYVEVMFRNEANVIKKAKLRLTGKGDFEEQEDESVIFKGTLRGIGEFKKWVLGFGSSVIVLKPQWLRDEIIQSYQELLGNYKCINAKG